MDVPLAVDFGRCYGSVHVPLLRIWMPTHGFIIALMGLLFGGLDFACNLVDKYDIMDDVLTLFWRFTRWNPWVGA